MDPEMNKSANRGAVESTFDVSTTTPRTQNLQSSVQQRDENGSRPVNSGLSNVEGLTNAKKKKTLLKGAKEVEDVENSPIPKNAEDKIKSKFTEGQISEAIKSALQKRDENVQTSIKGESKFKGLSKRQQKRLLRGQFNISVELDNDDVQDSLIAEEVENKIDSKVLEGAKKTIKKPDTRNEDTILNKNPQPKILIAKTNKSDLMKILDMFLQTSPVSKVRTKTMGTQTVESPKEVNDDNVESLLNSESKNLEGLSRGQKKKRRLRQKNENAKKETSGSDSNLSLLTENEAVVTSQPVLQSNENFLGTFNLDLTEHESTNNGVPDFLPNNVEDITGTEVGGGVKKKIKKQDDEKQVKIEVEIMPLQTPEIREQPNYIDPFFIVQEFRALFYNLRALVSNIPFDVTLIGKTVDDICRLFPVLGFRLLIPLCAFGSLIKVSAKMHAEHAEGKEEYSFHKFHKFSDELKKVYIKITIPDDASGNEIGTFNCFNTVFGELINTVFAEVRNEADIAWEDNMVTYSQWKEKASSEGPLWYFKDHGCASNNENMICNVLNKVRCDDEIIEVADATERRFFYDGSYYQNNLESWQNFQNLYLNCNVVVPVTDQSLSQTSDEYLVVADFTTNPRYLRYHGNYLEFWQYFQTLHRNADNLKIANVSVEADFHRDDASNAWVISAQAWENPEEGASVSDEMLTAEDSPISSSNSDSELPFFEVLVENDSIRDNESNSSFRENDDLNVVESNPSAIDYPLQYVRQFCNVKSVILSLIFVLVFKEAKWLFLFYCSMVGFMVAFMYLCIYFVIKF